MLETDALPRENTVAHWSLYSLDAIECKHDRENEGNPARRDGTLPEAIYEFAAGDDSIVFRNYDEISTALSNLALEGSPFDEESRLVTRRADATDWDTVDVKYRYRLTDAGREALLVMGIPQQLPNRDIDNFDRSLGMKPAHEPGWWQDDWQHYDDEWNIHNNEWIPTDHDRVFYAEEADMAFEDRGYQWIGAKLADEFDDTTFVLSIGPHRPHDLMYVIRDPWRKVVQIDIYSPLSMHRTNEEVTESFKRLVYGLAKALESVTEDVDE